MPSVARARPASALALHFYPRSAAPRATTNDSTPVRLPNILSPPAMKPQTPTKHPALRLRGGRRTSLRFAPFPVLLQCEEWGAESMPQARSLRVNQLPLIYAFFKLDLKILPAHCPMRKSTPTMCMTTSSWRVAVHGDDAGQAAERLGTPARRIHV